MGVPGACSLSLTCLVFSQLPETPAPAHRPPEDEGEEGEDEGEDEEWEDVSEDDEEEEEIEEEEEADDEEEEPAGDHQPQEAEPSGSPSGSPAREHGDKEPTRPEEPLPLPQAPATPSSPFSPPGGHQPVSDWGEEMELNSPRTTHPADAVSPGEAWPFENA